MRFSTAAAILILATGVAPSVALPPRPLPKPPSAIPPPLRPLPRPKPPFTVPPPLRPPPPPPNSLLLSQPPLTSPPPPLSPLPLSFIPPPVPGPPQVPAKVKKLEPLRRPADPPEPAPVQKSFLQRLFGKLRGRTLIADNDEVVGQPYSRRELLERFDELIMLAARAYEREQELLVTPMDDLD